MIVKSLLRGGAGNCCYLSCGVFHVPFPFRLAFIERHHQPLCVKSRQLSHYARAYSGGRKKQQRFIRNDSESGAREANQPEEQEHGRGLLEGSSNYYRDESRYNQGSNNKLDKTLPARELKILFATARPEQAHTDKRSTR